MTDFFDALLAGDATKSCALVSGESKRKIVTALGRTCENAIPEIGARYGKDDADRVHQALKNGKWQIDVSGDEATVTVRDESGGSALTMRLTRTGDRWYIAPDS